MKIKNVSVKVIGILGNDLLPDQSFECHPDILKNGAIKTLVSMGLLAVDDSAEKAKALKEEALREARAQLEKEAAENASAERATNPAETATKTRKRRASTTE